MWIGENKAGEREGERGWASKARVTDYRGEVFVCKAGVRTKQPIAQCARGRAGEGKEKEKEGKGMEMVGMVGWKDGRKDN